MIWSPIHHRQSDLRKLHWNRSSISWSKLYFKMEVWFWIRSSISKLKLYFAIEAPFQNRSFISKSKLDFEIKALFFNRSSILKSESKLDFKIKAPCWNRSSISGYGKMYWFLVKKCWCWQNSRVSHMIHTFFGSSLGKV